MATKFNKIEEALADLKAGKVIIICDDENRENEGDFVALGESVTPELINFMITHGRGLVCVPVSLEIANKLQLNPMVNNNTDNLSTAFTVSIDHKTNTTGISAFDRCVTIKALTDSNSTYSDFRRPGHIFPLIAKPNGVLERAGHTEATIDLIKILGGISVGVVCEIVNPDGTMARRDALLKIAKEFNLKIITVKELIRYRKHHEKLVRLEAKTSLPTKFGNFTIYGYTSVVSGEQITVIMKGEPEELKSPYVRIHSECLTGDVFGSLRCDCGEQLSMALEKIEQEQQGLIIYLKQEGRGIGLINKLKAYELQQQGYDTVDANIELGFEADLREYFMAAQVLKDLNVRSIRLATNNPCKIDELTEYGIDIIERVPVNSVAHDYNQVYLDTKTKKFGHLL